MLWALCRNRELLEGAKSDTPLKSNTYACFLIMYLEHTLYHHPNVCVELLEGVKSNTPLKSNTYACLLIMYLEHRLYHHLNVSGA